MVTSIHSDHRHPGKQRVLGKQFSFQKRIPKDKPQKRERTTKIYAKNLHGKLCTLKYSIEVFKNLISFVKYIVVFPEELAHLETLVSSAFLPIP